MICDQSDQLAINQFLDFSAYMAISNIRFFQCIFSTKYLEWRRKLSIALFLNLGPISQSVLVVNWGLVWQKQVSRAGTSNYTPLYLWYVNTCPCFLYRFWHTHDDVIKWKHFPRYWPFVRGIHRSRWNPRTKASDAELWCFLWSARE